MAERKPSPAEIAYSFYMEIGHIDWGDDRKRSMIYWREDFYFWDDGIFRKRGKDDLKALLVRYIAGLSVECSTSLIENVMLNLKALSNVVSERLPDTWFRDNNEPQNSIVTNKSIVTFEDNGETKIQKNTPDFFALNKMPYGYDPSAECPKWMKFVDEVTMEDAQLRRTLQQWAGYLLIPTQEYESFLLLKGEAATGKSTFARVMKAMLGKENCSDVPLRRFVDKFALYMTYGKKLNVAGDAEQELTPQVEAIIKAWTGKDGVDYERKWGHGFTAEATAKLLILSNDFPSFTDKSMGTWRRLVVVPFNRVDTSIVDPYLDNKLIEELPGILNWAIEGLKDLKANRRFVIADASQKLWEAYKEESNPAAMFLAESYEWDESYHFGVRTKTVYDTYKKWGRDNGYMVMSSKTFGKEVARQFPKATKRRMGGRDSRYYVYNGLKFKSGAEARDYLP